MKERSELGRRDFFKKGSLAAAAALAGPAVLSAAPASVPPQEYGRYPEKKKISVLSYSFSRLVIIWVILFMAGPSWLNAQEVWFFTEGTDPTYYDQGIVDVANLGESLFEYTHPPGGPQWNDKVPCSTNAHNGSTSLKFNYTSSANGNWKVKIFRNDWSSADITGLDTLAFFIYSEAGMPGSALPLIGLHAMNISGTGEVSSQLYGLTEFNGDVTAAQWTRMVIPLDGIMGDPDNSQLDFSQTKAVLFNQSESDNSSRVFLADDVVAYKSLTDIPAPADFTATGYDSHAELTWKQPVPDLSYSISASFDGGA
ncbi:MAG: hypothetical protein KAT15_10445, partial [Bacteroidales bacterium]|nr:hypothetical protein [Bacteroidales bacterium]